MANKMYVIAGRQPWNFRVYEEYRQNLRGHWWFEVNDFMFPEAGLCASMVELNPRYIFFLHWSRKVSAELVRDYECVAFHMADLPFGRGGSPLQNLIAHGFRETMITAFRMTDEIDAGPIYLKRPLSLDGLAEEIYIRATRICLAMAAEIARDEIQPVPQDERDIAICGKGFKRRTPEQSEIPHCQNLGKLFDHLRMLDADGYPRAYLDRAGYRYEFSRPALRDGRIVADVEIRPWGKQ